MSAGPLRRILHFAEDSDTSGFFPQLARWHDRSRYKMVFGTLKPMAPWLREHMESQGVRCFSCECRCRREYPLGLMRLSAFLRRESVDILHTHLFDPSVVGLQAGILAGTPVRVVTRHHSDYHTRIGKRWHVLLDQLCTRQSHAVIAVSQHTAEHLVSVEGAPRDKVRVILNGVDFERVRTSGADARERVRRELAIGEEALLLTAARLHPEKGYEHLFRAVPEVRRLSKRSIVWLVAGTGPFEERYREMVRAMGCADVVRFLGFRGDLPDLMAAADLFVLASVTEAFGLVLAESLGLGTPVVATRVGGIPEIVDDGVDGQLVAPCDSPALATAIAGLLNEPAALLRLRGAGRSKVMQRFRFEEMMRRYESVYQDLLSPARPAA